MLLQLLFAIACPLAFLTVVLISCGKSRSEPALPQKQKLPESREKKKELKQSQNEPKTKSKRLKKLDGKGEQKQKSRTDEDLDKSKSKKEKKKEKEKPMDLSGTSSKKKKKSDSVRPTDASDKKDSSNKEEKDLSAKDDSSNKSSKSMSSKSMSSRSSKSAKAEGEGDKKPESKVPEQLKEVLKLEPEEVHYTSAGGMRKIFITNFTKDRRAIKVKCSDNQIYRVNPVFAYIEPGQTLGVDILREVGTTSIPKCDKMVFLTAKAREGDNNPRIHFQKEVGYPMMVLPLITVD